MGIDDLRKKNSIPEPPSSHEGLGAGYAPSLQSVANSGIGVSANGEDLLKTRTETIEPQNSSVTGRGTGGSAPKFFSQEQDTFSEEKVTGTGAGSGVSTQITTEHTQNSASEQETAGTGPGVFGQDVERGRRTETMHTQRLGGGGGASTLSFFERITSFFQNLPDLWQVDAVCIALTVVGLIAIILNLPSVLAFIFGILYAVISLVFTVVFFIALIVGAVALLFRRGRRR